VASRIGIPIEASSRRHFYCSLKLECEKLAQEKTEMQRHYVMVSERISCAQLETEQIAVP
jgi:hypothetical protein